MSSKVQFMSLSSGSCGNCYYLGSEAGGLIIDAGVSLRRLKAGLAEAGLGMDSFSAILVTHDHMDHIRNLGSYCKKLGRPVYASTTLHRALAYHTFAIPYISGCRKDLKKDEWNEIGSFLVRYFVVPHDATQTCGFAIQHEGHKFLIMTDIGRMTDEAVALAQQADTVVIESNYDVDMLMGGPYTHDLKMRICQGNGHLSNDECAAAVARFWHPGLRNLFLCHLSENNNTRDKAYDCTLQVLRETGVAEGSINFRTLPRQYPSPLFTL